MPRRLVAFLIAAYAIAFAFGAMGAIRWPSLMMLASLVLHKDPVDGLASVDWRQLGIVYGTPYFLAALCLYASATCVGARRRGGLIWFLMGCAAGFPCVFLVDFEANWWRDPSVGEGIIAGTAAGGVLLALAVWNLRAGLPRKTQPVPAPTPEAADTAPKASARAHVYKPTPAMVARQRAMWAAHGQRQLARQRRRP